jgi:alpha-D-xyloside xylohydrolase
VAPVRALVSDFTADRETYGIDDEYMFTDNLLVAPMTADMDEREIYLPGSEWVDYFTRKPVECGKFIYRGDGIPVYEKIK